MGLIIKQTETKKIEIPGTDITLPEVYVRYEFAAREDGKTVEIAYNIYLNKEKFAEKKPVTTSIPVNNLRIEVMGKQDNDAVEKSLVQYFNNLGYDAEIESDGSYNGD